MTNQRKCGYEGHYCGSGRVQFISRYRGENDYCVDGRRISVSDDGKVNWHCEDQSPNDVERIRLYELAKYADYILTLHVQLRQQNPDVDIPLQPFSFVACGYCEAALSGPACSQCGGI